MTTVLATDGPPAAAIGDPAQLLVVLVEERSGVTLHVADRRGGHAISISEAAEAPPAEDPVDSRGRSAEQWPEAVGPVPPTGSGGQDLGLGIVVQAPRRAMWPGAPIEQPSLAFDPVAANPLVGRGPTDPKLLGNVRHRPA
jgi:hypothetical protein